MNMIFGNRHAWLRGGLVAAAMAAILAYAEWNWEMRGPDIKDCLREPERYHGARVWFGPARVLAVDDGGFLATHADDDPVRVRAVAAPASPEDQIAFRARFHRGGYVELEKEPDGRWALRPSPGGQEKRVWMYAMSLGVLAGLGLRFFLAFRVAGYQISLK